MKIRPLSPKRYVKALRSRILARFQSNRIADEVAPEGPVGSTPDEVETAVPEPADEPAKAVSRYASLYEEHALALPSDSSIGDGDFELIGRIELSILVEAGLRPSSYLFDFGCGTGRLAVHAVPYLQGGSYLGTDISPTMLRHARAFLTSKLGAVPPNTRFEQQSDESFPTDIPPDIFCAFSVFTHMEHEDVYRYLVAARKVSGPGTVFVASCLPMDLVAARDIFLASAGLAADDRWKSVRNVVTSRELFEAVATLAGWSVSKWYPGDTPATVLPDGTPAALGQSVVIMRPTDQPNRPNLPNQPNRPAPQTPEEGRCPIGAKPPAGLEGSGSVKIAVLVGGVGGAKFLLGVKHYLGWQAYGPAPVTFGAPEEGLPWERAQGAVDHEVVAIVNTADDIRLHNLQICPDLDSCMYTLAGAVRPAARVGPGAGDLDGRRPSSPDTAPRHRGSPWATRTSPLT